MKKLNQQARDLLRLMAASAKDDVIYTPADDGTLRASRRSGQVSVDRATLVMLIDDAEDTPTPNDEPAKAAIRQLFASYKAIQDAKLGPQLDVALQQFQDAQAALRAAVGS